MALFLGHMFGSMLGAVCDRFGRKTVFCITSLIGLVTGVASAFPPNTEALLVFRFITGAAGMANYLAAFVLVVEMVGEEHRSQANFLTTTVWLMGPLLLALVSFLIRHWHHLQLLAVLPFLLTLGHWWLLSESPRWLLTKERRKAALAVLRQVARVNRKPFPPSSEMVAALEGGVDTEGAQRTFTETVTELFKHPRLVAVVLIVLFNWCIITVTFYGLSLNVGNLGGSLRVNFFLSCAVELIGYVLCWRLLDRLGRKRSVCCFMLLAGLACLASILSVSFAPQHLEWVTTALAMVGKLGISASFSAIFLFSTEIFPTLIRNSCMSCCSLCGRVGGVVTPYIAHLAQHVGGRFGRAVPLVIFGGLAVLAGLLVLYLPETLHRPLPDTLEEAFNSARNPMEMKQRKGDEDEKPEEEEDTEQSFPTQETNLAI